MSTHHKLDIYPSPKDEQMIFINEPWIIDNSIEWECDLPYNLEKANDNLRIYVPLHLNKEAILRRVDYIINRYSETN